MLLADCSWRCVRTCGRSLWAGHRSSDTGATRSRGLATRTPTGMTSRSPFLVRFHYCTLYSCIDTSLRSLHRTVLKSDDHFWLVPPSASVICALLISDTKVYIVSFLFSRNSNTLLRSVRHTLQRWRHLRLRRWYHRGTVHPLDAARFILPVYAQP